MRTLESRPDVLPLAGPGRRSADRDARLRRAARARRRAASATPSASSTPIPSSPSYGRLVGQVDLPDGGNELHHFGWNACSSHLCPYAPHAHVERRYLVVPGTHSSRIHIIDTKPDPRRPRAGQGHRGRGGDGRRPATRAAHGALRTRRHLHQRARRAGRRRPGRDLHARPRHVRGEGRAGSTSAGRSTSPTTSGWHLGHDTMITSEWGTPNMVKDGVNPELLLAGQVRPRAARLGPPPPHAPRRRSTSGAEQQMVLELRPAHDPRAPTASSAS